VRRLKEALTARHFAASAAWGVLEHFAAGITTIGDTGSSGAPARAMAELGARGVAFHEVFGPDPGQLDAAMSDLARMLSDLDAWASERVRIGLSPHAPYTVSEPLLRAVADAALTLGRPLAMHLAESREEDAFVRAGTGPFAEAHERRGIPVTARGLSPVAWALSNGLEAVRPLLIHCVKASDADLARMAACAATVAHCPWSNAALGHGRAGLAAMRRAGLAVGLGTDSVVAGNATDLFAEARYAAVGGGLSPRDMLGLITGQSARALAVAGAGALSPGAWGDLTAVSLGRAALAGCADDDPEAALAWSATAADVEATWVAGHCVYEHGHWPGVDTATIRCGLAEARQAALAALAAPRVS
jgi:5-methylthioadenosine/S-adenosylhomocysteine deaminase